MWTRNRETSDDGVIKYAESFKKFYLDGPNAMLDIGP